MASGRGNTQVAIGDGKSIGGILCAFPRFVLRSACLVNAKVGKDAKHDATKFAFLRDGLDMEWPVSLPVWKDEVSH